MPMFPMSYNGYTKDRMDASGDDGFEKSKAIQRLMYELNKGKSSGEKECYVPSDEVRSYFISKA